MARAGWLGFAVAIVFGVLISALVWPLAPWIAGAYTQEAALIALAAPALVLSCLFFAADSLQVVAAQALRARGEVWLPTFTHILSYAAIMAPLGWWLAHPMKLGLSGIIWAVIVASLVSAGCLVGRFWLLSARDKASASLLERPPAIS